MSATLLPQAASKGDYRTVRRLVATGVPANTKGAHGATALHFAAEAGNETMISCLLHYKACVDVKTLAGLTPLHKAAEAGHAEACTLLLKAGASPDVQTPKHVTALLMATEKGHASVCAALLAGGANPAVKNPAGVTPMLLAIQLGHAATAGRLAGPKGTDPNSTTPDGLTLLEYAAKLGQGDVIRALIGAGADVQRQNAAGNTALHKLVESWRDSKLLPNGKSDGKAEQYEAAGQALLDGGSDPWTLNKAGKSPLNLAADRGCTTLQQMFVKHAPCPLAAEKYRAEQQPMRCGGASKLTDAAAAKAEPVLAPPPTRPVTAWNGVEAIPDKPLVLPKPKKVPSALAAARAAAAGAGPERRKY